MCQPVTSNFHRCRLRSAVRGGLIVPPTKTVRYGPCSFAPLRNDELSAMSFRRQLKTELYIEHSIHTSTLVTVFTVRVDEHNFILLTYLH